MRRSEPALKPRKGIRSNALLRENPYFLALFESTNSSLTEM
jgi:hypothetical protein